MGTVYFAWAILGAEVPVFWSLLWLTFMDGPEREPPAPPDLDQEPTQELLRWVRLHGELSWGGWVGPDDGDAASSLIRYTWKRQKDLNGDRRYEQRVRYQVEGHPTDRWTSLVYLGEHGFGVMTPAEKGEPEPQPGPLSLELPPFSQNGQVWTSLDSGLQRTCRVTVASPFCASSRVVTCRSTRGRYDSIYRTHYCEGEGIRGREYARYVDGELEDAERTSDLAWDGVVLFEPDSNYRPLPGPNDVPHPPAFAGAADVVP